jgi:hypothetical protein
MRLDCRMLQSYGTRSSREAEARLTPSQLQGGRLSGSSGVIGAYSMAHRGVDNARSQLTGTGSSQSSSFSSSMRASRA